jgi:hypothetical protein
LDKFRDQEKSVSKEKKKKGEHRMYSVDDEKWEKNLKKELDQKKRVEFVYSFISFLLFLFHSYFYFILLFVDLLTMKSGKKFEDRITSKETRMSVCLFIYLFIYCTLVSSSLESGRAKS